MPSDCKVGTQFSADFGAVARPSRRKNSPISGPFQLARKSMPARFASDLDEAEADGAWFPVLPVGTQHLASEFGVVADGAPGRHADGPTHRAHTAVPQADLHASGVGRLGDSAGAIGKFRRHLERQAAG